MSLESRSLEVRDRIADQAAKLNVGFARLDLPSRLIALRRAVSGRIVFTTSFGIEDQVVTHALVESGADIEIATLDTGRLFPETYGLWAETEAKFGLRIKAFYPDHDAAEKLVQAQGINGFYTSVDARKACCGVRKVEPLGRALAGAAGWVTGLRADQSIDRSSVPFVAFDETRALLKANPLTDWTRDDAAAYAAEHGVPINPLHARGFLSIGCHPCTRAVRLGESERAGRWWWESEAKKECGLHIVDGRVVRNAPQMVGAAS